MNKPIKQLPTRVWRTYRGGKILGEYLGEVDSSDSFYPEDWISSFVEAKNKVIVKNEGLTRVLADGDVRLLRDAVTPSDFGDGRLDSGILIKFLDAAERLGIQVHPTKQYACEVFSSNYGKTECWHILKTRSCGDEPPCVYLGFREGITKEIWSELFRLQDIPGMLAALHKIEVKPGDTILVTGGTPHAIGAGCFMLEIQEPSDYTMRTEKTTVAGDTLTPMQIHYGVGEEKMLDCFEYSGASTEEIKEKYFLKKRRDENNPELFHLVTYEDTPCFKLDLVSGGVYNHKSKEFVTVIITGECGTITYEKVTEEVSRGDKYFIPSGVEFTLTGTEALISYPPKK